MVIFMPVGVFLVLLVAVVVSILVRSADRIRTTPTMEESEAKAWALAQGRARDARARFQRDSSEQNRRALEEAEAGLSTVSVPEEPPVQDSIDPADPIDQIRRLAQLRDEGIVSEEEFAQQKASLLARLT